MNDHLVLKVLWFWGRLLHPALKKACQKWYRGFLWSPCCEWENKQAEAGFKENNQSREGTQPMSCEEEFKEPDIFRFLFRKNRRVCVAPSWKTRTNQRKLEGNRFWVYMKTSLLSLRLESDENNFWMLVPSLWETCCFSLSRVHLPVFWKQWPDFLWGK